MEVCTRYCHCRICLPTVLNSSHRIHFDSCSICVPLSSTGCQAEPTNSSQSKHLSMADSCNPPQGLCQLCMVMRIGCRGYHSPLILSPSLTDHPIT